MKLTDTLSTLPNRMCRSRFTRPAWTTATTLPLAFVCGIMAGVFIWWGGRKTKRTEEVQKRLRMALAMEHPTEASELGSPPKAHTSSQSTVSPSPKVPHVQDYTLQEKVSGRRHSMHSIEIIDEMIVPPADEIHGRDMRLNEK